MIPLLLVVFTVLSVEAYTFEALQPKLPSDKGKIHEFKHDYKVKNVHSGILLETNTNAKTSTKENVKLSLIDNSNVFLPSINRMLNFLQHSMKNVKLAPSSVAEYKSFLDNCEGTFKEIFPSDICVDLAEVHRTNFAGKNIFGSQESASIANELASFLQAQEGSNTAKIESDLSKWMGILQSRVTSHPGVPMQVAVTCAQLPESHENPNVCARFVAAHSTLFKDEDIFSSKGETRAEFLSTLATIVVLERKETRKAQQPKKDQVRFKQYPYPQTKGQFVSEGPYVPPATYQQYVYRRNLPQSKGSYYRPPQSKGQSPNTQTPYDGNGYAGPTLVTAGASQTLNNNLEKSVTPSKPVLHREVDDQGMSTIPDYAPVVADGGLDVPLSFRLGYPTIANHALDLSVFKTQVREDCAFALNTTVERFAVVSVEPSFNNRYVNVILRVYPEIGNDADQPTAQGILINMKRQILNEVSPLRLGIATRHLFIPGDTTGKHFEETYIHPNYNDNGAGSSTVSFVSTLFFGVVVYVCAVFA